MLSLEATKAAGPLIHGWVRRTIHGKASTRRQLTALCNYMPTASTAIYQGLGGQETLAWAHKALDELGDDELDLTPRDGEILVLGLPYGGPNLGKDSQGQFFSPMTDFMDGYIDTPPVMYTHGTENDFEPEPVGKVKQRWYDRRGGWFKVQLDPQSPRYGQLIDANATGNLRASTGAIPASVSSADNGHIDTWMVGELSLVDLRDGYRPVNSYAITKAEYAGNGLFEDYYGQPVEEREPTMLEKLRATFNELMKLFAEAEAEANCDPMATVAIIPPPGSIQVGDPYAKAEEVTEKCPGMPHEEVKLEETDPVEETVIEEKCTSCDEAKALADALRAEVAGSQKCARCPDAIVKIRSLFKAGKIPATEVFGLLDKFVESDAEYDTVFGEIESRTVVPPLKAEKGEVVVAAGQPRNPEQSIDNDHMNKQRRLAGLPGK